MPNRTFSAVKIQPVLFWLSNMDHMPLLYKIENSLLCFVSVEKYYYIKFETNSIEKNLQKVHSVLVVPSQIMKLGSESNPNLECLTNCKERHYFF